MANKLSNPVVAIVGATGAVGVELIRCLEQRRFPLAELRLFASARSSGKSLPFRGKSLAVQELTERSFGGVQIGLFSAGSATTKKFAKAAVDAGAEAAGRVGQVISVHVIARPHDELGGMYPKRKAAAPVGGRLAETSKK